MLWADLTETAGIGHGIHTVLFCACFTESISWTHRIFQVPKSVAEIYGCQRCSDTKHFLGARPQLCPWIPIPAPSPQLQAVPKPCCGVGAHGHTAAPRTSGSHQAALPGATTRSLSPRQLSGTSGFLWLARHGHREPSASLLAYFKAKQHCRYRANSANRLFFTHKLGLGKINMSKT